MNNATISKIDLTGIGALYHRLSTDHQDAERQRTTTREFLARHGATVKPSHIFEDEGWSRADADRRPDFQRMLALADAGKINWFVVDRQDRAEAYDKWDFAATISRLRKAKCRLYTCDGEELTAGDILTFLKTGMSSEASEKELREKSMRVLEGKRELRSVANG